jgi:hypothetical protein
MLLIQLVVLCLQVDIELPVHEKLLGKPRTGLLRAGLFEGKTQVKQVAEVIVLINVQYRSTLILSRIGV